MHMLQRSLRKDAPANGGVWKKEDGNWVWPVPGRNGFAPQNIVWRKENGDWCPVNQGGAPSSSWNRRAPMK